VTYAPFSGVVSGLTGFMEKILKAPVKIMQPTLPAETK